MRQTDQYDERPSVAERYSTATEASNLRVKADQGGAADLLIAAGWCGETLGATLFRLRADYDKVAANVRGTANDDTTERLLILMQLGSNLSGTKEMLGNLARKQALVKRVAIADRDLMNIASRCLQVFLDPNCNNCDGRGFNGGGGRDHTGPQVACKRCKSTGKRDVTLGRDDVERGFAGHLLYLMECATSNAEEKMSARLRKAGD